MNDLNISSMGKLASFRDDYGDECTFHISPEGETWVGTGEAPMMLTAQHARELGAMLMIAASTGRISLPGKIIESDQPHNPSFIHAVELLKRLTDLEFEAMINIMNMVVIAHDKGAQTDAP